MLLLYYDTAITICKGGVKTVKGCALYDTAMEICKGVRKQSGVALYDTVKIICKGCVKKVRGCII